MHAAPWLVLALLLAGCASEPKSAGDDASGANVDGNSTAAPSTPDAGGNDGPAGASSGYEGSNSTGSGNATGNATANAGGNASANQTIEPVGASHNWAGQCSLEVTGVVGIGPNAMLNSNTICSVAPDPPTGYKEVVVTATDNSDAFVGEGIKLTIVDAGGTIIGVIETGSAWAGSGTFALGGALDLTTVSISASGKMVGQGKATIDWDFVV